MQTYKYLVFPLVLASALAMTACSGGGGGGGGGGDGDSTTSSTAATSKAQGLYSGTGSSTTPGVTITPFQLLILENDEYWWMYGDSTPSRLVVESFTQGQGKSTTTTFTSLTNTDFGDQGATDPIFTATYVPNVSINGTVTTTAPATATAPATDISATVSAFPLAIATYDYNAAANLAAITGAWPLTAGDGSATTISISATGAITGYSGSCSLTGTIAPRESGKNVFNTSVTFGPAPCLRAGQTFTGIGLSYPIAGTITRQLVIAGVNSGRTADTTLYGTR